MQKPLIAITGKTGQLGTELALLALQYENEFDVLVLDKITIDLAKPQTIDAFFAKYSPNYFINAAAYTAVDKAEEEKELAYQINAHSVGLIAKYCKAIECRFITISTDYVFDGNAQEPYLPNHPKNPVSVYGSSKAKGEDEALANNSSSIIIRTSWVYNKTGKNFVNTVKRLMNERTEITVINNQTGCPTYAADLAEAIFTIVHKLQNNKSFIHQNIYHFSNTGNISWYNFAVEIARLIQTNCKVLPIHSSQYPTVAQRPNYSVLNCTDFFKDFELKQKDWKESLQTCLGVV